MALLVLLSAAARARIVAPDLRLVAFHLLDHIVAPGACRARRLCDGARAAAAAKGAEWRRWRCLLRVHRELRRTASCRLTHRRQPGLVALNRRQAPEVPDDLFLDAVLHRLEERKAFLLVFD